MTTDLTTIKPPNGDQNAIAKTRRLIADARIAKVAEIEAATDALTAENYAAEKKGKFKGEKDAAKAAADAFLKKVLAASGADAVTIELAAYQTAISKANNAYEERWDAIKAANAEKMPTHTYFLAITATDEDHAKIRKAIEKTDAAVEVVMPQKDAEWRTAAKLFGIKE